MAVQSDSPVDSANEFKQWQQISLKDARFPHEMSKARNAAYASPKYTPSSHKRGNKVWLNRSIFLDSISRAEKSDKLRHKHFGPFTTLKTIGKNAVRLMFPENNSFIQYCTCVTLNHISNTLKNLHNLPYYVLHQL